MQDVFLIEKELINLSYPNQHTEIINNRKKNIILGRVLEEKMGSDNHCFKTYYTLNGTVHV